MGCEYENMKILRENIIKDFVKKYIDNKKIILFGAGERGKNVLKIIQDEKIGEVLCFIDNKIQEDEIDEIKVLGINKLGELDKENVKIIVCVNSYTAYYEISKQLLNYSMLEGEDFISSNILKTEPITNKDNPYEDIYTTATYAPWIKDEEFIKVFDQIRNNTLVDIYKCYELWDLIKEVSKLEDGIILEIGVWRGGTGCLIGKRAELLGIKDKVYLCDTFEGVVKTTNKDCFYKGGEHSDTSKEIVENLVAKLKLNNTRILKGIFPDETSCYINENKIRFCHIDVDVYKSAKDILDFIWDKLVIGGIIIFDDFGFKSTNGITILVEEIKNKSDILVIENLNGHAIIIKIK